MREAGEPAHVVHGVGEAIVVYDSNTGRPAVVAAAAALLTCCCHKHGCKPTFWVRGWGLNSKSLKVRCREETSTISSMTLLVGHCWFSGNSLCVWTKATGQTHTDKQEQDQNRFGFFKKYIYIKAPCFYIKIPWVSELFWTIWTLFIL